MFYTHIPLSAFSENEREQIPSLLVRKISSLGGIGKLEEEHWTSVYCEAKGIEFQSFSNIFGKDVELNNGDIIEMKCIRVSDFKDKRWIMHPSLTRKVPEWTTDEPAEVSMVRVVKAYNNLIEDTFKGKPARWGILLYLGDFTSFMYFEYPIVRLNPDDLTARYSSVERVKISRRSTTNLWIYDKEIKIMSVTSPKAGMKIQPYFYIPAPNSNRYLFDLGSQPIPIEKSIQNLIFLKASKEKCTPQEVIEKILKRGLELKDESFVAEPAVTFDVVRRLGGIGSDWKGTLIRLLSE